MLVVIDVSPYIWLFGDKEHSLQVAINDAGGEIIALFFAPNECLEWDFKLIKKVIS